MYTLIEISMERVHNVLLVWWLDSDNVDRELSLETI